jgi:hypothetical protein
MPEPSLRDRFFTRRVASALTSPSGILLAGAGAAVGIVAGLPIAAAALLGAAAWGARVAAAVGTGRPKERIDAGALDDPWRGFVREAQRAQARYARAAASVQAGPLRDRLNTIGARIDDAVRECWRVACHGQVLVNGLDQLDVDHARRELAQVEDQRAHQPGSASLERTAQALRSQLDAAERVERVATDARDRLRLLDARLDEAVARAVELSLGAGDATAAGGLEGDVERLVDEMESLRVALDDAGPTPSATPT